MFTFLGENGAGNNLLQIPFVYPAAKLRVRKQFQLQVLADGAMQRVLGEQWSFWINELLKLLSWVDWWGVWAVAL